MQHFLSMIFWASPFILFLIVGISLAIFSKTIVSWAQKCDAKLQHLGYNASIWRGPQAARFSVWLFRVFGAIITSLAMYFIYLPIRMW